jgi:transposase
MARYIPDETSQSLFVTGSLESLLPVHSVARVIWDGVRDLDFSGFDGVYRNDTEGRPAVDPRRLTAVWILATLRGIGSSVEVARLCQSDIEFRWLSGDCGVQKSTLSSFRTGRFDHLCDISTQVLAALSRSDLLPGAEVAIDGSVIRAAASCRSSVTAKKLRCRIADLEKAIRDCLSDSDDDDDPRGKDLVNRKDRFEEALAEMSRLGLKDRQRMTITEPEASFKRMKDGSFAPAHNVQVVSDLSSGAIISVKIVDQKSDQGQLLSQVRAAQAELRRVGAMTGDNGSEIKSVVADAAYHDTHQLVTLESERIIAFVPDRQAANRRPPGVSDDFLSAAFDYHADTDTMQCPRGHSLRRRKMNSGKTAVTYEAPAELCQGCTSKQTCCPATRGGRNVNRPIYAKTLDIIADRVNSDIGKRYRHARSVVAEGVFGRMFGLLNWRRCLTWGGSGAQSEGIWCQIALNLMLLTGTWQPLVPKQAPNG